MSHFDISPVDIKIPLQSKTIKPARATASSRRVLVKNTNTAFHGGNLARAAFQVTPPFGRIMAMVGKKRLVNEHKGSSQRRGYRNIIASVEWKERNEWNGRRDQKEGTGAQFGGLRVWGDVRGGRIRAEEWQRCTRRDQRVMYRLKNQAVASTLDVGSSEGDEMDKRVQLSTRMRKQLNHFAGAGKGLAHVDHQAH